MRKHGFILLGLVIFALWIGGLQGNPGTAGMVYAQATDRPFQPVTYPTATSDPSALCLPLDPARPTAEHTVSADIDYAQKIVVVDQRIQYANRTGQALNEIVLNLAPDRWHNVLTLEQVRVENADSDWRLQSTRLTIPLDHRLAPECAVTITLNYRLDLPLIGLEIYAYKGYFGYSSRQINLGHWLATVAPFREGEWITRTPFLIGEQEVLELADWDVTLNVMNSAGSVIIAAPGYGGQLNPQTWRYTHLNAREFAVSLSDQFHVARTQLDRGVVVEAYTLPGTESAAAHFLMLSAESLDLYADLFGSFTDERMVVVQGDFPDGMEFHGLVFVGDDWFTGWDGQDASYLTLITVHEMSHQWWYARVGNDSALTPWLDEAFATYSEHIYLENFYPDLLDWWWYFRVNAYAPEGAVDSPIYEFETIRAYINAVYLRGVKMLHALRADLGDEAFFQFLRDYAAVGAGQIATPELLWSLLTPEQLAATSATRTRYLRQPDVWN